MRSVTGRAVRPRPACRQAYSAAEVDSHHLEGEKKNHLVVNLARKAMGQRRPARAVATRPARGQPADAHGQAGRDRPAAAATDQGHRRALVRKAGRPCPGESAGQSGQGRRAAGRVVPRGDGRESSRVAAGSRHPVLRPVLAFMFTQEPVTLRLAAERRKPQVTIRQLLVARIDEGVIKYQATFFYTIQYSGVKSLRIDVPADVTPRLPNTTAGIRLRRRSTRRPPTWTRTWSPGAWRAKANCWATARSILNGSRSSKARRGQALEGQRSAAHSPRRRSGLGPDRAGQGRNARLPGGRGPHQGCAPSTRSAS